MSKPTTPRARNATRIAILALAVAAGLAGPARAHTPSNCKPLFLEAAKSAQAVVRKSNAANDAAMAGLNRIRYVGGDEYATLADRLGQLRGWQKEFFQKLAKAIKCVDGRK